MEEISSERVPSSVPDSEDGLPRDGSTAEATSSCSIRSDFEMAFTFSLLILEALSPPLFAAFV